MVREKGRRPSAVAEGETVCDVEVEGDDNSLGSQESSSARVNRKGLHVLTNNLVSMQHLDLAARVHTKCD